MVAISINLTAVIALIVSLYFSKDKTSQGLKKAGLKAISLAPLMLIIITGIGLLFAFISPELIKEYLGGDFNIIQVMIAAVTGAILMIPSLIALPLAGSLVEAGASYTSVAAFITTLTMVGFMTLPIEIKELGKRITLYRNLLALVFAILISFLIGVIM